MTRELLFRFSAEAPTAAPQVLQTSLRSWYYLISMLHISI